MPTLAPTSDGVPCTVPPFFHSPVYERGVPIRSRPCAARTSSAPPHPKTTQAALVQLDALPRSASVAALTPCELLQIDLAACAHLPVDFDTARLHVVVQVGDLPRSPAELGTICPPPRPEPTVHVRSLVLAAAAAARLLWQPRAVAAAQVGGADAGGGVRARRDSLPAGHGSVDNVWSSNPKPSRRWWRPIVAPLATSRPTHTFGPRLGAAGDKLYILAGGEVELLTRHRRRGLVRVYVVRTKSDAPWFGELALISWKSHRLTKPRVFTARTLTQARVLTVAREHFDAFLAAGGGAFNEVFEKSTESYAAINEQMQASPVRQGARTEGLHFVREEFAAAFFEKEPSAAVTRRWGALTTGLLRHDEVASVRGAGVASWGKMLAVASTRSPQKRTASTGLELLSWQKGSVRAPSKSPKGAQRLQA